MNSEKLIKIYNFLKEELSEDEVDLQSRLNLETGEIIPQALNLRFTVYKDKQKYEYFATLFNDSNEFQAVDFFENYEDFEISS